jgi:hypothetical protein
MAVSKRDSKFSQRRGASFLSPVDLIVSVLSPVDVFVNLLFQPERQRDGVREDIEAARWRQGQRR